MPCLVTIFQGITTCRSGKVEWSPAWGRPALGSQKFSGYIQNDFSLGLFVVHCSLFIVHHLLCLVECLFTTFCFTSMPIFNKSETKKHEHWRTTKSIDERSQQRLHLWQDTCCLLAYWLSISWSSQGRCGSMDILGYLTYFEIPFHTRNSHNTI